MSFRIKQKPFHGNTDYEFQLEKILQSELVKEGEFFLFSRGEGFF